MSTDLGADDDEVRMRRMWRLGRVAPLLVAAGCAVPAEAESPVVAGTAAPSPTSPESRPADDDLATQLWTVVEVVDGDTIRVAGDSGEATVRLVGVDAPERDECFHEEATDALRFAIGSAGVRLERDVSDVDQFGRWLRFVETPDGIDIGGELVAAGYSRSHWYEPDTSRNAAYDGRQSAARNAGAGLWADDACGTGHNVAEGGGGGHDPSLVAGGDVGDKEGSDGSVPPPSNTNGG
jgi:endonuclease YncB( thermonuclease family)